METSALASSKSDFVEKIRILENENKKIHDEFNIQRAKLKDLFIQKESECVTLKNQLDEIKSQFLIAKCKKDNETLKAQEEISSLQHLVQETIEESTICKIDLEKLLDENNRLKLENQRFKEESIERPELSSLTPVFSQVRKTLTKKLVGEGVEDSIKKIDKYAQEDAEVLRSIVVPLEEEIKALKEKIRSTDDELQLYKNDVQGTNKKTQNYSMLNSENKNISNETLNKSTSMEFSCENCALLQGKIFTLEEVNKNSEKRVQNFEKLLSESKDELIKEAALRKDLEIQWQEKREIHKEEILNISEQLKKSDEALGNVAQKFLETKKEINEELSRLIEDREKVNERLEMLQRDNDYLSGRFLASSEELENQKINLPNNVQELHEQILRLQSDLLHARIGFEFEKRKNVSYIDENIILRDQLKLITEEREEERLKVQNQIKSLEFRLQEHLTKGKDYEIIKEKTERKELEMSKNMSELRVQILELQGSNDKLKRNNEDLKSKIINLQEDLKTSEHVQKDFVKLSQSLQVSRWS